MQHVYDTIRLVVEHEHSLACRRGDNIYSDGIVIEEIWRKISSAHLLIADLTGRNPNVFYEVGLAHALLKHVVILAQDDTDVPFDLRHRRMIIYDRRNLETLRQPLSMTVGELKWQPPQVASWIPTNHMGIRVGLETPLPGSKFSESPFEARGRVVGIPPDGLTHSIQAFVRTDKIYEQVSGLLDQEGFWRIDQVYLGSRTNHVFFKVLDETGRILAITKEIKVSYEARV